MHKSEIKVTSEIGKGTTFWFELKLKKGINHIQNKQEVVTESLEDKRVLLAEDNAINAQIAIRLLSRWGIVTDHAKNGKEAVEKAKNQPYDFILMDIHMPEMDGFEATAIIRNGNSSNKNIPIYALTADISAKDNNGYNNFFNGFLLKPLEIDKLHKALLAPNTTFLEHNL